VVGELVYDLGAKGVRQLGIAGEIGEQYRDLAALAFPRLLTGWPSKSARRFGRLSERVAAAAAKTVVWLVDEAAYRAACGQRRPALSAKASALPVFRSATGTLHR
jgi:hypothetical protein